MLEFVVIWVLIVYCVDVSGGMNSLSRFIWSKLYPGVKYVDWRPPLIGCSLCMTFWAGILYLIISKATIWWLLFVILLSFMSDVLANSFGLIKDIINYFINKIYENIG